jgi:inosine-uridine nucleoside N-ribohydrolase
VLDVDTGLGDALALILAARSPRLFLDTLASRG